MNQPQPIHFDRMESPMWGGETTRQQLQQSITLLQLLNEVPELPKENDPVSESDTTHRLSISRENEIASILAFLSAISDHAQRIMAVCIEENPDRNGITIRVASNMGDLSEVTYGFEKLAKSLEQAARRENPKFEDQKAVLRNIVDLDIHRILTRLRSRHAERTRTWKTIRKPLITQLNETIQANAVSGLKESNRKRAKSLEALFNKLESILDISFSKMEVQSIIEEIVKEAYEFSLETDLTAGLQNSLLNPSLKMHLPVAMGKLGKYYSAASELVCAARDRNCPIFKRVKVEPFQIQIPPSIGEIPPESQLSSLPQAVAHLLPNSAKKAKKTMNLVQKLVAEKKYPTGVRKIHAEIQLLFYYELHPDSPRPRVICSSKSACYLCNVFFQVHGRFHVPRSHGRLYDKWILPDWLEIPTERGRDLNTITTKFKAIIDGKIKQTLASKQSSYNHPNESVLLPEAHWSDSVISEIVMSKSQDPTSTIRSRRSTVTQGKQRSKLPTSAKSFPTPPRTPQEPPRGIQITESSQVLMRATSDSKLACNSAENLPLSDAVSVVTIRSSTLPHHQLITLTTPSLHLEIDELSITLDFIKVLSGRLSIARAEDVNVRQRGLRIVDIEDIPTATELQLDCSLASNEVTFQLQNGRKGILYVVFVWDDPG